MSTKPKTIDNLGVNQHYEYIKSQQEIDPKLIRESGSVPLQTEVATTESSFSSHTEKLFDFDRKNSPFAKFTPPKGYQSHQLPIFTYQMVPSMGSYEKQEVNSNKVKAMQGEEEKKEPDSAALKEIDTVAKMLDKMGLLDKYLTMINSRREQYHKG